MDNSIPRCESAIQTRRAGRLFPAAPWSILLISAALGFAAIFLIFFAPTPGGAGLAESASLSVMASIIPDGFAPHYNLLWRVSTAYLAAAAGPICLVRAIAEEAGNVLHHRRQPS